MCTVTMYCSVVISACFVDAHIVDNLARFERDWIRANPQEYDCSAYQTPGSEGNHGQTAKHRQYCVNVARLGSNLARL